MDLDHLEAGFEGARGCRLEGGDDPVDPRLIEGDGGRLALVEWHRARRQDVPAAFVLAEPLAAQPWCGAACLASGMRELDARNGALALDEAGDAGERRDMLVAPQSHVAWRDAAVARDRGRLDHDQPDASGGAAAEMDEVPVIGETFMGRILAHWGHGDAIAERHVAECERAQKTGCGNSLRRHRRHVVHRQAPGRFESEWVREKANLAVVSAARHYPMSI